MIVTRHLARRLVERKIAIGWVQAAITTPDWTSRDPDPTLTRSYKSIAEFGGRVLRVVHRPDGDDVVAVTAVFDRGARRPR
jgi:hypothetical protein